MYRKIFEIESGDYMKKPKFVFRINRDNTANVYINKKWQKYVSEINIIGLPHDYTIKIKQYKKNDKGKLYTENNEVAYQEKEYHFLD